MQYRATPCLDDSLDEDFRLIVEHANSGDGIFPTPRRHVPCRFHGVNHTTLASGRMQAYSGCMRRDLLTRIGLSPTELEIGLHAAFESGPGTPSLHTLRAHRNFDAVTADKRLDVAHTYSAPGVEAWPCHQEGPRAVQEVRHWSGVGSLRAKSRLRHACIGAPV
jgi:hypothetical protein